MDGMDVLDIGGNLPVRAIKLSDQEEIDQVAPIIKGGEPALMCRSRWIPTSAPVAEAGLKAGADLSMTSGA